MKERIQQIMEKEGLPPSRFAEEIGIQRAAMSHILTGRNNPSLDVVTKILQRYPVLNAEWLLFGKGEMYQEKITGAPHLFKNTTLFADEDTVVPEYRKEIELKPPQKAPEAPQIEQVKVVELPSKKVTKIMLFYSDSTYDTFIPEEKDSSLRDNAVKQ